MANPSIYAAFERLWQHIVAALGNKADISHVHDDVYSKEEMDATLEDINTELDGSIKGLSVSGTTITYTKNDGTTGTITTQDTDTLVTQTARVTNVEFPILLRGTTAGTTTTTNTTSFGTGVTVNPAAKTVTATTFKGNLSGNATSADSATKATQDASGNTITSTYETKTDANTKLNTAKTYTDEQVAAVKNDLLNGAGTAYDTLKELGDLIDDNTDAIDALEAVAAGKADSGHSHAISDITNLQTTLNGKADYSHGTHVTYSSTAPVMDGTASVGSASTVARSDHKHPTDTSRASQEDLDSLTSIVNTKATTTALNTHINDTENPHNVTLTQLGLTATAAELNKMDGVTATTAELNYVDGVTSNIQTQLNNKVPTSRTVNGKALTSNISLSAADVGADASGAASSALSSAKTYTDEQVATKSQVRICIWEAND